MFGCSNLVCRASGNHHSEVVECHAANRVHVDFWYFCCSVISFSLCCFSRVASKKKSGAIYLLTTPSPESFMSAVSKKHHTGGSKWGPSTPLSVKYLWFSRSFRQKYCKTRIHSSRIRTFRCRGVCLGVCVPREGVCPRGSGHGVYTSPLWTDRHL